MEDNSNKIYTSDDILAIIELDKPGNDSPDATYNILIDGKYVAYHKFDHEGLSFNVIYEHTMDPISRLLINSKYLSVFNRATDRYNKLPENKRGGFAVAHVQILQWTRWLITHDSLDDCPKLNEFEQHLQSLMGDADCDFSMLVTSDHIMEANEYSKKYRDDMHAIYQMIENNLCDTIHIARSGQVNIQAILNQYKGRHTASEKEIKALIDLGYAIETKSKGKNTDDIKKAKQLYGLAYYLSGDNIAANNLGYLTSLEASGEQDINKAVKILTFAADHGNDMAMVNLGNIYEGTYDGMTSDDFEPNPKQAAKWYLMAGMMGNKDGVYNYANLLHWGIGVRKDYATAFRLFKYLYDKYKIVGATFYMGMYYENGYYVDKNYTKAAKYYQEAVDQDDSYSCCQLGRLYSLGKGVDKDGAKGIELYLKAGKLGDPLGYANAAYAYEHGESVDKDMKLARKYYNLAADQGEEHAIEWLDQHPADD